ncbi:hypothetical protein BDF19DRAFT_416456 [Syncephalis fuscata]|nr:hypothetical protein BDF19DRAFT_416456 [Syncephalis fuscata]
MTTCELSPQVLERLKEFRFMRTDKTCALIFKINPTELLIVEEQFLEDITLEELVDELPENQPRYPCYFQKTLANADAYNYSCCYDFDSLVFQLTLKDNRVINPLVFIYYNRLASSRLNMLYASSKTHLEREANVAKVIELREAELLTMDWLRSELAL